MAQQIHYPSDPLQPGPMYFLTPRKCGVFGVCNEALPRQVNFLIEEACDTGKGANNIISKLHYFFERYGFGEEVAYLHADNCTGQNKNNAMMQYLAWRVMTGLHKQITLSFLVVGHTKFSPDWLFKKRFRLTKVGTLTDIAQVVEESATVNVPQICGTEDHRVVVPTYNWKTEFAPKFKTIPHIKSYHHFRLTANSPGTVYVKTHADTEEIQISFLRSSTWSPSSQLPLLIQPLGLSPERQWYLHDHSIREFCPEYAKDIVAPLPQVPKSGSARSTAQPPTIAQTPPAQKRMRQQEN